jgi:glycosyltransferase involved in cell wall biosynthesis
LDRIGKRWIGARADAILANSHAVAEHLPFSGKVNVVHNGVDPHRFQPVENENRMRARFGIPADRPVVGMAGRLRPWKGVDRLIRAAAVIGSRNPGAQFLVVGGSAFEVRDGYAESLPHLAAQLNIADKVFFTGQLEDVRPALAAMDVFVHPGDPEPFGLVNVEAMAMGKPVVAFAHGALPEIVLDQITGILVPPGDLDALVSAVLALLSSPEKAAQMGKAGRARVEAHFTARKMTDAIDALLSDLLAADQVPNV